MALFVYGFLGALMALLLFSSGAVVGWAVHRFYAKSQTPSVESPGEQERRRLIEEQQAFRLLQNYSVERAYGQLNDFEHTDEAGR